MLNGADELKCYQSSGHYHIANLWDKWSSNSIAWIKLCVQLVWKPHKLESDDGSCCTHVSDYIYCQLNLIAQLNSSSNHNSALSLVHTWLKKKKHTQMNLLCDWPLAHSYGPSSDDPQGDAEDQQHRPGADSHEGFHYKPCVKMHLQHTQTQVHTLSTAELMRHCNINFSLMRCSESSSCAPFPTQT